MLASQATTIPTRESASSPRAFACLNAITHGGTAETLFILGEDPAAFDGLLYEAFSIHQPVTTEDAALVTDSVVSRWMLWRRQSALIHFEHQLSCEIGDSSHWRAEHFHSLHLLDRYKTQAERSHQRTFNQLRALRKDIDQAGRWQEQLALQKQRFSLSRERFEFAQQKHAQYLAAKALREEARQARAAFKNAPPLANASSRPANHARRASSSPVGAQSQPGAFATTATAAGSL